MAAATTHPPHVQAILDGTHDADLDLMRRAIEARAKHVTKLSGIVKGARVLIADDKRRAAEFAGKTGLVVKVNKLRTTVAFACPTCGKDTPSDTMPFCESCYGCPVEANIPTDMLSRVSA